MNWRLIEEDVVEEAAIKPGMSLKNNKYIKNWSPDYGNVLILAGGAGSGKSDSSFEKQLREGASQQASEYQYCGDQCER